jgi:hypothetical protein
MRELADAARIRRLMRGLGAEAAEDGAVYLTGGATAVLVGWRAGTVDVDILPVPEQESVLRAVPRLKDELRVNVELASPRDFIPVPALYRYPAIDPSAFRRRADETSQLGEKASVSRPRLSRACRAASCSADFFERPVPTPTCSPSIAAAHVNWRSCGGPSTSRTL